MTKKIGQQGQVRGERIHEDHDDGHKRIRREAPRPGGGRRSNVILKGADTLYLEDKERKRKEGNTWFFYWHRLLTVARPSIWHVTGDRSPLNARGRRFPRISPAHYYYPRSFAVALLMDTQRHPLQISVLGSILFARR